MNYEEIKELAIANGVTIKDLCALAPKNDPFYTGRPAEIKAAIWFAEMWRRVGTSTGVHLRRVHYWVQAQDPPIPLPSPLSWKEKNTNRQLTTTVYINNDRCWEFLVEAGKWARYLQLVPASAFVDRRNPEAVINAWWPREGDWNYQDTTPGYDLVGGWDNEALELPELPELPGLAEALPDLPGFLVTGYEGIQQPYHVEIWCEKTTMNDVLIPICRRFGVNLVVGAGELSITAVVDFIRRARNAERPCRILYISDFDPAGLGMPISVARKIEFFQRNEGDDDLDIRLHPIVLTPAQIARYRLPRVPVKDSDLRKGNFEEAYGAGQVELDALEALYPGELARIVQAAILQYYDTTLQTRARQVMAELEEELRARREDVTGDYRDELAGLEQQYNELLSDFEDTRIEFDELVQDFLPQITAYQHRLEEIKRQGRELYGQLSAELKETVGTWVNLADFSLPDPALPDEDEDLLYDSRRDYMEQLDAYKSYRHGLNGHNPKE
jgi:hypothetical protein